VVINANQSTPPTPIIGTITQPTCNEPTGSVVLNNLPSTGTWTLKRNPGGISTTGTGASTTIAGLTTGSFTFSVSNAFGCISAVTASVVIKTQPVTPTTPIITLTGKVLHSDATKGNQWYNQIGLIEGASDQDYTVLTTGEYYVIVTNNGCSSPKSNVINVVVTGLDFVNNTIHVQIYPNPINNELIIELEGNSESVNIIILNSVGQTIYKSSLIDRAIIQTTSLTPGIYLIKLETRNAYLIKKMMKE
jgi:hypothetical protein